MFLPTGLKKMINHHATLPRFSAAHPHLKGACGSPHHLGPSKRKGDVLIWNWLVGWSWQGISCLQSIPQIIKSASNMIKYESNFFCFRFFGGMFGTSLPQPINPALLKQSSSLPSDPPLETRPRHVMKAMEDKRRSRSERINFCFSPFEPVSMMLSCGGGVHVATSW